MSGIARDEWLKALGEAVTPDDPDALTVAELAAEFDISRETAYRHAEKLVEAGRAIRTRKRATGPAGMRRRVPAYKLIKAKR